MQNTMISKNIFFITTFRIRLAERCSPFCSCCRRRALFDLRCTTDSYVDWEMKNTHTRLPDYPSD